MNNIYLAVIAIWAHWLADFVLQSDVMAKSKSSSVKWLSYHVLVYTAVLWAVFGWKYAAINGAAHFIVDFATSKINSKLWGAGERHWFFVTIGVDQSIHMSILLLTLPLSTLVFV